MRSYEGSLNKGIYDINDIFIIVGEEFEGLEIEDVLKIDFRVIAF